MKQLDSVLEECRAIFKADYTDEDVLKFLRTRGISKAQSVYVIARLKAWSLNTAKNVVHHSETWADTRETDEAFADAFAKAADEALSEQDSKNEDPGS